MAGAGLSAALPRSENSTLLISIPSAIEYPFPGAKWAEDEDTLSLLSIVKVKNAYIYNSTLSRYPPDVMDSCVVFRRSVFKFQLGDRLSCASLVIVPSLSMEMSI
jgi:hypothetical protein